MPELPEVEVVKQFLEIKLLHQQIIGLDLLTQKSFIGDPKQVVNQTIVELSRVGKQLSIHLSNHLILLVHLKMTGQLILDETDHKRTILGHPTPLLNSSNLPNKSTRLIFSFKNFKLYFNDQRKFGWIKVFDKENLVKFQSNLGLDIFSSKFSPNYLYQQVHSSQRPIKLLLLDQHRFAGIGNIYANDALFLSRIHPQTSGNKITPSQSKKLVDHLVTIMQESVLSGGSTAKDNKYVRPDGSFGSNQFHFRVYQRQGEPCLKCNCTISYIKVGGRGTFFCPNCQKL